MAIGRSLKSLFNFKWVGLVNIMDTLTADIRRVRGRTANSMHEAGRIVRKRSLELTPKDTGNLKRSVYIAWGDKNKTNIDTEDAGYFINKGQNGKQAAREKAAFDSVIATEKVQTSRFPFSRVGYTATYAIIVHENLKGVSFKVGQAKFLEQALLDTKEEVMATIRKGATIKE